MASAVLKSCTRQLGRPAAGRRAVRCHATAANDALNRPMGRRVFVGAGLATALVALPLSSKASDSRIGEVQHSEEEWRKILGSDAYFIMRQAGTEFPLTSPLNKEKRPGTFLCAGCSLPLFDMSAKYDSGTGWPSFYEALPGAVDETSDLSIIFMPRTEVRCHRCKGHLGHVFNDGPAPTGLRYCMNGLALRFEPAQA